MHSESLKELATALSKAQSEIHGAKKNSENPHFKSSFANLESVWDAARVPLTKNGLSVVQTLDHDPQDGICLVTTLLHSSGEWMSGRRPIIAQRKDPQGVGSAITYARRYDLMAIVGIAPEDDDGEAAMSRNQASPPRQSPPPRSTTPPMQQQRPTPAKSSPMPQSISAMYDWVVPFGKKYNGVRIGDIPPEDAINYAEWLEAEAHKKNRPLDGDAKTFYDIVAELRMAADNSQAPQFSAIPNDEVPF